MAGSNQPVAERPSSTTDQPESSTNTLTDGEANHDGGHELERPFEKARSRPRTYPYFKYLPYDVEDDAERQRNFDEILKYLYIAVESGDISLGATHWTRELRAWLALKFDPTREQRAKLVRLYYELSLAPGIDPSSTERFASMFMALTKRKHYLRPVEDLILDWRPLYREMKVFVLPSESDLVHSTSVKRNIRTLTKFSSFAQLYFDPTELPAMLEEFLPHFTTSFSECAFVVVGLMNLFLPTTPGPEERRDLLPQNYLPTYFHIWSLVNRSRIFDTRFLDLLSRLARDFLPCQHVPFSEFGVFTSEQTAVMFSAIMRTFEFTFPHLPSVYSNVVDMAGGLGQQLEKDSRNHPSANNIARLIIMSLSPACLEKEDSVLGQLESLMQVTAPYFHPSNLGPWSRPLAQLTNYLADFFVMRWNRERSGELDIPEERRLNDAVKQRFVRSLREPTFTAIYSKSGSVVTFALATLESLAYLEPNLILPAALQRIYPSMQGLIEVHRTTSSLRALQVLSKVMVRSKGYRCHITTLLALALPGIDANDLGKSLHSLTFIQAVCYNIPLEDLTKGREDVQGDMVAMQWVTGEIERMEQEGDSFTMNYDTELSDTDEELILRSSTSGFAEFLTSFLGRVFTLLENLPDAARVRSGSPEENVANTLPAVLTPLLASLSGELYDIALSKIVDFVGNHVIHQARDAMAFICNAVCKVNPEKALKRFIPLLISGIRTEIDENGAASTRTTGTDVLPRDRGLIWNISMLSMCVVHVGSTVLNHRQELIDIALYMQENCKGIPTVHISNFIHHLLLNLTTISVVDHALYEPTIYERGVGIEQWGQRQDPKSLTVKWHVPQREELDFAVELFKTQGEIALNQLAALISDNPPIKRDGTGKEWSDELSRNVVLLRLLLAGIATLFNNKGASEGKNEQSDEQRNDVSMANADTDAGDSDEELENAELDVTDEGTIRRVFTYPAGYQLTEDDPLYKTIHEIRHRVGQTLHNIHVFLVENQEDDVNSFSALSSAYRSWFTDVGIERSAHVLDRVAKLYAADVQPYKINGVRKDYPRPLLVRRANVYHLQRLRVNALIRPRSKLDEVLLLDLAQSSVSVYTDIRRNAQAASESALRVVWGSRPLVIPPLIQALQTGIKEHDYDRMKGALHSLLYSSLAKTLGRHWKYTPTFIKAFIEASTVDKPSIQRLCTGALFQTIDYGRDSGRAMVLDKPVVKDIAPATQSIAPVTENVNSCILKKRELLKNKRIYIAQKKADLAEDLVDLARGSHWKQASRTAAIVVAMGLRFDNIASENLVDLVVNGAIDTHPGLRGLYAQALVAVFTMIDVRAVCSHKYENYVLGKQNFPTKLQVTTRRYDPTWTAEYLASFAKPEAEYYVDHEHPGWLVWDKTMPAYSANASRDMEYDDLEWNVRQNMGRLFTRKWITTYFSYLKQEPRDSSADKFRMSSSMLLLEVFKLIIRDELTAVSFDEIKEEISDVFGDGNDKHQHRATAEILGGLLSAVADVSIEKRTMVWEYAFPIVQGIFSDGLTPENTGYWNQFLRMIVQCRDVRRAWPLVDWLANFRLDMTSNAAFKESSKINLLHQVVLDSGWHFQLEKPIVKDFLAHLDHPYKGVREAMGHTLASIFRTRYHESYPDIEQFIKSQREASPLGTVSYQPTEEFSDTIHKVFGQLEIWRQERTPGQTDSSYASGGKTVLLWLDAALGSYECAQLAPFLPKTITEQLLHMMDIKEDTELGSLAFHVFRNLPNITDSAVGDDEYIDTLVRIGLNSPVWHQRLRVMVNMQAIYFRRLFQLSAGAPQKLFDCVASMLEDSQNEVRLGASSTLSFMIQCSPPKIRDPWIFKLRDRFIKSLNDHPMPKRPRTITSGFSSATSTGASTPTPEHTRLVIKRHASVLGLGALIGAFPFASPPPSWMPTALITLCTKAAGDPGVVGQGVKDIISEFKRWRQDTWHIDEKVFEPDQLEELSGVLWKSYFA